MAESSLVSVIVPIYNTAQYLPACIESLLAQTYSKIEFILVDDGSSDDSLAVCQSYAAKDSRIKVLHQQNAGCATARNTGLQAAQGEYIGFVDSDDVIAPNTYQVAVEEIQRSGADWVMWNMFRVNRYVPAGLTHGPAYQQILCHSILNRGIGPSVCIELFKADLIKKHRIQFRPEIKRGDDLFFVLHYGRYAQNIYYLEDKYFYRYTNRPQSLSHSFHTDAFEYPSKYLCALQDIFCPIDNPVYAPYIEARFLRDILDAFYSYMNKANPLPFSERLKKVCSALDTPQITQYLNSKFENYLPRQQRVILWLLKKKQYVVADILQKIFNWLRDKKIILQRKICLRDK